MKKRTCVIGYTKACRRLEQLKNTAIVRGETDQANEIGRVLSDILASARVRHEAANRKL